MRIPVQTELGADPNPSFLVSSLQNTFYPYPMRNQIKPDRPLQDVRVLTLENEYLICRVLPDFGGRLYSCRDKRNDREMLYANPVFAKDLIGIRGAWTPAGVENNFPAGHARDGLSPVDFHLEAAADGSGRAVVENLDRVTGMQWRVEFVLRPESTYIEQRVTFYNRSPARGPYYWWGNGAVAYDDSDTRFVLPTRIVADHGRARFESFPITSAGSDESRIAGHVNGVAWFAYGSAEPFFAVYKPKFRGGVAHFADPKLVPGKKLWLWGSESDAYVRASLTGNNFPSYVELQAGVFQDQAIFDFLLPEQSRQFSEYWIAVHDLGGISRVTRDAIVNVARGAGQASLLVELSVTHPVPEADVRLLTGGEVAFQQHLDLSPDTKYEHVVDSPASTPYTVQLVDSQGAVLLEHTENQYDALAADQVKLGKQPDPPAPDLKTEAGLLAHGNAQELVSQLIAARQDYANGMKSFPESAALRKAAGRLAFTLNRFDEAADLLARAAAPGDDEVSYLLGATRAALGQTADARAALSAVSATSAFYAAARLQLALAAARDQDYTGALEALEPLLDPAPLVARPGALEVALLRRAGRKPDVAQRLALWQALDPADNMLRFERILLGEEDADFWLHMAADAERVLDLADQYVQLGMFEEAVQLLDHAYPAPAAAQMEPGAVAAGQSPLVAYYRAWCRSRLQQPTAADLKVATALSTTYVFPFRASSMAVLKYAVDTNGSDATAHFLLGRLLMYRLQVDEAAAEIKRARALNPKLPELAAPGPRAAASAPAAPAAASPVAVANAALLQAASGNAAAAAAMFNAQAFSAEKQPDEVRRAYIEVQLQRLLATAAQPGQCPGVLDALEKLGDEDKGLPFTFRGFGVFMKPAHFQYYVGAVMAACGQTKDGRKRWERVGKMKESLPSPEFAFPLLAAVKVNPAEARPRIEGALAEVRAALPAAAGDARAALLYLEGVLLAAAGQADKAGPRLKEAQEAAQDVQLKYLAGLGLRDSTKFR